jgi:hypothetical protein
MSFPELNYVELPASSEAWLPGVTLMSTLKRLGKDRNSFTRMLSPINVAIEPFLSHTIIRFLILTVRDSGSKANINGTFRIIYCN